MAANKTHNEIELRPPHGARFMATATASVLLVFQRGEEQKMIDHLKAWIDEVIVPEAIKYEEMRKRKEDFENSPAVLQQKLREFAPEVAAQVEALPSYAKVPRQCDGCGTLNDPDASFCKSCGFTVSPKVTPPAPEAEKVQPQL